MTEKKYDSVIDIKPGDIILVPNYHWLLFVTKDLKLMYLTSEYTIDRHLPEDLKSIEQDIDLGKDTTYLWDIKFHILGNIKDLITLAIGYKFND